MRTVFFVEDDANIVAVYRESLVREGFEVKVAEDGVAAMRLLQQGKPDLVILDLMMPKFNGADVLRHIRTDPALKQTKVIIFSNAYETSIVLEAEKSGADAFLLKLNCTPEKLVNVVKTLLHDDTVGGDK